MSYSSMLEAFEALNQRRLEEPDTLTELERKSLKHLRTEIEEALFARPGDVVSDRREFLRAPVQLEVRYWTADEMRDRYISILGEGGLFIPTDDPLPEGSRLELDIGLELRGVRFHLPGVVANTVRSDIPFRSGMGVRFLDLTYEQKCAVYQVVRDAVRGALLERRRGPRLALRMPLWVVLPTGGRLELITEDLSALGVLAQGDARLLELPATGTLPLGLGLPGAKRPLALSGRMVRRVQLGDGRVAAAFEFLQPSASASRALVKVMSVEALGLKGAHQAVNGRRLYPRIKRRVPVQVKAPGVERARMSFARDISRSGVFLHSLEPLRPGERLEVLFETVNGEPPLHLSCEVVRTVSHDPQAPHQVAGVGATFLEMRTEVHDRLRAYLRKLLQVGAAGPSQPLPPGGGPDAEQGPERQG